MATFFNDPISGTIGTVLMHGLEKKAAAYVEAKIDVIGDRLTLLFEMGIAGSIAFLVIGGTALLVKPIPVAVGSGMIAAGVALFATFKASQHSKGLIISVTDKVAEEQLENPVTTIERK